MLSAVQVTAQLICTFGFAYADFWFTDTAAPMFFHTSAGIWGSAFCIQLKRLLQDDKKVTTLLAIEQEREELGGYTMKDFSQ